ncbi:MAG: hypothetical protein CVV56_02080 [Tenericutes bacterium HGW-Tenericutes-1]|jgi:hypothetical protein|nr:MAG: hypothetical protein CVV56_02080 [Tenericutes bacterium HGW-Tenericutes-1]
MEHINKNYLNKEISRVTEIINEKWEEYLEFYTERNNLVKSYVYGPAVATHRGYYNPSPVVHHAIRGCNKGPKPKPAIGDINGEDIMVYGLDVQLRPIYIQTWSPPNRPYQDFEIIQYFKDKVIGITFDEFEPIGIHETQFEDSRITSILTCYYNHKNKPSLENCQEIIIELFDNDRPNHFQWKWVQYNPNLSEKVSILLDRLCEHHGEEYQPIKEMLYEFDTDQLGKVSRMYFDRKLVKDIKK